MFCVSDKNIIFKKMFFLMLFTQNEWKIHRFSTWGYMSYKSLQRKNSGSASQGGAAAQRRIPPPIAAAAFLRPLKRLLLAYTTMYKLTEA